ncbi:N-6 DNA methylase [Streptomyces sp. NPDC101206]|uniref:type I restriction-modification system subunit M n=1 Tax=Streptomyces sp. NPDC101206 TaxID=3366128 RepID=UPI003820CDCB
MRDVPPLSKQPTAASDLLWKVAATLRSTMDAADYKSVALPVLYLRFLSSQFEQAQRQLDVDGPVRRDFDALESVRWLPPPARWETLAQRVRDPETDPVTALDEAINALERSHRDLADLFPPVGTLVRGMERRSITDLLALFEEAADAEAYDELLAGFAGFEGKGGGEFHTPKSVARLLVETLQPQQGTVYDPCCGSGGMLVEAVEFMAARGGDSPTGFACYGQEVNPRIRQLARMNLDIHGIPADLRCADTLERDQWPTLKADFVLANPPLKISDWPRREADPRWRYGIPPRTNANFAWLQHAVDKLGDHGSAGIILANGSLSSKQMGEGDIRKAMVEDDLVACLVALPARLFRSSETSACVWFLTKDKSSQGARGMTDRRGQTLFIDANAMGEMSGRAHRVLTDEERTQIAGVYRAWRGVGSLGEEYRDVPGFCRSAGLDEIRSKRHILTPGRYVGGTTEADQLSNDAQSPEHIRVLALEFMELLDTYDELTKEMRRHLDR